MISKINKFLGLDKFSVQWKVLVDSATGTSHQKTRLPCQDYGSYEIYDQYLIGAIADGAGTCDRSDIGAKLVVDQTLYFLKSYLSRYQPSSSEPQARSLFLEVIKYTREKLQNQADSDQSDFKQYSCTLLAFVVSPDSTLAMQLGDGFIVVRKKFDQIYTLLFEPAKGEFNNETIFITAPIETIQEDLQVKILNTPISFLCASTDGMENLALDLRAKQAFHNFFVPLEKHIQEIDYTFLSQDQYIANLLQHPDVNKKTDDDKTLLICSSLQSDLYPELQNYQSPPSRSTRQLPGSTRQPPIGVPVRRSGTNLPNPGGALDQDSSFESQAQIEQVSPADNYRQPSGLPYLWLCCNCLYLYFAMTFFTYFSIALQNYPLDQQFTKVIMGFFTLKSILPISAFVLILGLCSICFAMYIHHIIIRSFSISKRTKYIYISLGCLALSVMFGLITAVTLQNAYPTAACMQQTLLTNLCRQR